MIPNPPGAESANKRQVYIPNYPNDYTKGGEWYDIDLNPLFDVQEDTIDDIASKIGYWYTTLRWYLWQSEVMFATVRTKKLDQIAKTSMENSRTYIEKYVLPGDHDYIFFQGQVEWLKGAVESIMKVHRPMLQTFAANERIERNNGFFSATRS